LRLTEVRTVVCGAVAGKVCNTHRPRETKIRNLMSALWSHAIRQEWITFNPIAKVSTSAKRLREPDVLTPVEFRALLRELPLRERAAVMLAGSTGLRRSELFALRWRDVNFFTMEISVTRSVCAESLRRDEDGSQPQTRAIAPFSQGCSG
jgi:integrase